GLRTGPVRGASESRASRSDRQLAASATRRAEDQVAGPAAIQRATTESQPAAPRVGDRVRLMGPLAAPIQGPGAAREPVVERQPPCSQVAPRAGQPAETAVAHLL